MPSPRRNRVKPLVLALAMIAGTGPAAAYQFKFDNGLTASVDTTLSYGISIRDGNQDKMLIGITNGGTSRTANEDDGDLNYKKGDVFSNVVKASMDV